MSKEENDALNELHAECYTYKVKCRQCGNVFEMVFGQRKSTTPKDFQTWAFEHATFPFHQQCQCDRGSMMIHDLVSYCLP